MSESQTIHLAADLSFLHTDYLWRMPGSWVGYDYYSTSEFYEDIARIAQRGVMDMLFFGDTGGTPEDYGGNHDAPVRYGAKWPRHDMAPMIPLMAKAAPGVGFAHHHVDDLSPSVLRRALLQCARPCHAWPDRLERRDVGLQERSRQLRLRRDDGPRRALRARAGVSRCHLQAVGQRREGCASSRDREKGIFADPAKVHRIDHRGRYFNVRGPLPALPSPQQRPVIIQAGLSGPGMDLAATYADMQFSTRRTLASMKQHRDALDAKLADGRPQAARCRHPVVDPHPGRRVRGRRQGEGAALSRRRSGREAGLVEMSAQYNVDFSKARPGMRLADFADEVRAQKGNYGSFDELLKTTDPTQTVEEFGRRFLVDRILVAAGTPKAIVDKLEEMHFASGANGGFILGRGYSAMDNIREFVELVVPELQRRGLSKTQYTGPTLRENLN